MSVIRLYLLIVEKQRLQRKGDYTLEIQETNESIGRTIPFLRIIKERGGSTYRS